MISALIGVLIIVVIGAICFWAIDKFVRDGRLANLLKLLVVLICLAAILQRLLPLAGIGWLLRCLCATEARFGWRDAPPPYEQRAPTAGDQRATDAARPRGHARVLAPLRRRLQTSTYVRPKDAFGGEPDIARTTS